jgi:DNA-binding beta-propeller fold protein YncE
MKRRLAVILALGLFLLPSGAHAHPGSGIVADRQGNIYFVDTGSGVWKIDTHGKLTKLSAPAYHWLAIDVDRKLAEVSLPHFPRGGATVTRDPNEPAILVSSDFPITVGRDGGLCYPWLDNDERLQVFRLAPSGSTTVIKTLSPGTESAPLRWLNGLASGADGSLYYAENRAIRRITPNGELITVALNPVLTGCDSVPGIEPEVGPYLRGLDVDDRGTVYVAATGCRAVLRITADRIITTILRTPGPWSPTGVAVSGSDVYVLEYLHTPGDNRREWMPRVRKVAPDGRVTTVAVIDR